MPDLWISDEYFNRSAAVVAGSPRYELPVRYQVFARESGVVCGSNRAVNFIRRNCRGRLKIWALRDGQRFAPLKPVLVIEGLFGELVNLETTYLGMLAFSGAATEMAAIVQAAHGIPVIDMAARHYPYEIIEQTAYAAAVGGAAGTSTRAGYEYVHRFLGTGQADRIRNLGEEAAGHREFKVYGSIPHALNAAYGGGSLDSAAAYLEKLPHIPLTVLIDFEGRELTVAREAYRRFGDRLAGVRIDTNGGRVHEGGHETYDPPMAQSILARCEDRTAAEEALQRYGFGRGVTVESVYRVRAALDEVGGRSVKIVVSSGFNARKVAAFVICRAPMDAIGTGSWVRFLMFTSDITEVYEKGRWLPRCKVGRREELNVRHDLPLVVDEPQNLET